MTTFVKGRAVKTAEAVVTVDAGLAVGTHRFQLEVVTSDGRRSAPVAVDVVVSRLLVVDPLPPIVTRPTVLTDVVTPIRCPARPRKPSTPRARKPAKTRSET